MAVNIPTDIPAFTALSFNLNGAVSDPDRKLKWIFNNFVKNKKVDIILFQEVRFSNLADVRRAFWKYRGVLRGLSMNPRTFSCQKWQLLTHSSVSAEAVASHRGWAGGWYR